MNSRCWQCEKWMIAALLFLSQGCMGADEQQFGRLFTTPEQRQRLQALKAAHKRALDGREGMATENRATPGGPPVQQPGTGASQTLRKSDAITLQGLIYRNDGARMAWIKAQDGSTRLEYRQPEAGGQAEHETAVRVPVRGKSVKLKPGQSYYPESGLVTELEDRVP